VRLVSKDELYNISKIVVDDEIIVWRQGDQLINGILFYAAELLYFSDANTASTNAKIIELFEYLKAANPDIDDEYIVSRIGMNMMAFSQIMDEEAKNIARRIGTDVIATESGISKNKIGKTSVGITSKEDEDGQGEDGEKSAQDALSVFDDYINERR
jgi:hypothetical protein